MSPAAFDPLHRLIYLSSASGTATSADLEAILFSARKKNASAGVTGLLLFHDGCFFQVLEGPASAVKHLFEVIRRDRRHHGVIILEDKACAGRSFANWAMGYVGSREMTGPQRDSLIDLSSLLGGETKQTFSASAATSIQIDSFLASFREFAPV